MDEPQPLSTYHRIINSGRPARLAGPVPPLTSKVTIFGGVLGATAGRPTSAPTSPTGSPRASLHAHTASSPRSGCLHQHSATPSAARDPRKWRTSDAVGRPRSLAPARASGRRVPPPSHRRGRRWRSGRLQALLLRWPAATAWGHSSGCPSAAAPNGRTAPDGGPSGR